MDLARLAAQRPGRQEEGAALVALNRFTGGFGLVLTPQDALALTVRRDQALAVTGRLEFGGGMLSKLVLAFRDSPYLDQNTLADTLGELTELFYTLKNECMDALSDDELLEVMRTAFDGSCGGSLELLGGRELWAAAKNLRHGRPIDWTEPDEDGEVGTEDDEYH